jgi:Cu-Zn family superoxide dismutase
LRFLPAIGLLGALLTGCAITVAGHDHGGPAGHGETMTMMRGRMAVASLTPTQGSTVRGLVVFHEMDGHLMVHAKVSGLKPNGVHGLHVHETGSCASADGSSAGGHFNPDGQPHGPQSAAHHAGDLPALTADENGVADQHFTLTGPTLTEGPASLVGRSVIVHAQADDYTTQPSGNSGARIGCGVIAGH